MTPTHHDPNDRTAPRRCAACGLPYVPPRRGAISETCSGSRPDGSPVSRAERDRCRQARLRGDRTGVDARLLATFYGTGDPFGRPYVDEETGERYGHENPSPGSLTALAEEYGIGSWSDVFGTYCEDVDDEHQRSGADGLRPLLEERPLGQDPRSHKRRTGVEDAPDEVQDPDSLGRRSDAPPHPRMRLPRLPADLVQEADEDGLPYSVKDLKDDHPDDVL